MFAKPVAPPGGSAAPFWSGVPAPVPAVPVVSAAPPAPAVPASMPAVTGMPSGMAIGAGTGAGSGGDADTGADSDAGVGAGDDGIAGTGAGTESGTSTGARELSLTSAAGTGEKHRARRRQSRIEFRQNRHCIGRHFSRIIYSTHHCLYLRRFKGKLCNYSVRNFHSRFFCKLF